MKIRPVKVEFLAAGQAKRCKYSQFCDRA